MSDHEEPDFTDEEQRLADEARFARAAAGEKQEPEPDDILDDDDQDDPEIDDVLGKMY